MNLLDFAKSQLAPAKDVIEQGGELNPVLYFVDDNGKAGIALIPQYAEMRGVARDVMRELLKKHGATRYAFICEAWVAVKKPSEYKRGMLPSQDPDRQEAITVVAADDQGGKVNIMCVFARDAGHAVFAEPEILEGNSGPLLELLDPPPTKH